MKMISSTSFRALFLKHVYRFLGNIASAREIQGAHVIAVSGGLDSMTLLWLANVLFKQGKLGHIRAVFIHHHTRPGQDYDAQLIQSFCEQHDIPFEILHMKGLDALMGNFEDRARKLRRELLLKNLRGKECLWLGHHLDDSYEWSLMQRHRSNQPKSSLGIPARNGRIIRPFQCVSKEQLLKLSRYEKIIFREDPTNGDIRFERNYLRQEVIPRIKKRYPQYLKHYAYYSNYLAMILHLNITNRIDGNQIYVYEQGAIIEGRHFSQFQILELIHTYSKSQRGEITSQILKMLKAIDNGKKGPFHFSGQTEAYYSHHLMMIYSQKMRNYDSTIAKVLATINTDQLEILPLFSWKDLHRTWTNLLKASDAMMNMPGYVLVLENKSVCKTLNTSVQDSLFPEVSKIVQEKQLCFITSLKCLENWKKKKDKLPDKLRLLPLWTLANLFSSQG
jgi:tRNA(Ile)-lysidine synthase